MVVLGLAGLIGLGAALLLPRELSPAKATPAEGSEPVLP